MKPDGSANRPVPTRVRDIVAPALSRVPWARIPPWVPVALLAAGALGIAVSIDEYFTLAEAERGLGTAHKLGGKGAVLGVMLFASAVLLASGSFLFLRRRAARRAATSEG
jgi:hypothetical protein